MGGCCGKWVPVGKREINAVGPYMMVVWIEEGQWKFKFKSDKFLPRGVRRALNSNRGATTSIRGNGNDIFEAKQ